MHFSGNRWCQQEGQTYLNKLQLKVWPRFQMSDLCMYRNNRSLFQLQNIHSYLNLVHLNFHLNVTWGSGILKQNIQVEQCNPTSLYIRRSMKDAQKTWFQRPWVKKVGTRRSFPNILLFHCHFNKIHKIAELCSYQFLFYYYVSFFFKPVNHITLHKK